MKLAACMTLIAALGACATAPSANVERDLSEFYDQEFEYSGQVGGTSVAGQLSFERSTTGEVLYTVLGDRGPVCRNPLRRPTETRIQISCNGLQLRITRTEDPPIQAYATLTGSRPTERQECAEWVVDPQTRRRTCAQWHTVIVNVPVTHRGTVEVRYAGI